jgi:ABC-type nitrate/sulfonate/bicarbonate transport system substrate-binding protein
MLGAVMIIGILATAFGSWSCSQNNYSGPAESITIGLTNNDVNSLILVAQDQNYFAPNGINLTIKTYASGKAAVDGVLNREADMANSSEYAFAGNILDGQDLRIIGTINRSSIECLVIRPDKDIKSVSDLIGKKVGVPLKSRPEFALGRFLYLNRIDSSKVTLVNVPVDQSVKALVNGEVDAVATWQPYIDQIKVRLGNEIGVWSVQNGQPSYNSLVCTGEWTTQHPELISRFLKSLVQAESYMLNHSEAAKTIIQKKLNYDSDYLASVWPDYDFSVSLSQSLVSAMEDETRWIISNNLTTQKTVPDFVKYIYSDGLKAVKPGAVNIIK